ITVSGRSLSSIVTAAFEKGGRGGAGQGNQDRRAQGDGQRRMGRGEESSRNLDDAALAEIARVPGVAYVEPNIGLYVYVRANGRALMHPVGGAVVPNQATRFKQFDAGRMIVSPDVDEAVVDQDFLRSFGYAKPSDAVGQTLELLAPAGAGDDDAGGNVEGEEEKKDGTKKEDEEGGMSFFGLPLEDDAADGLPAGRIVARKFRIVGALKNEIEGGGSRRQFRGFMPSSSIYVPLKAAREWSQKSRSSINQVAMELARATGALKEGETEGYQMAVVRVSDPDTLTDVQKKLNDLGFSAFSIVDQLKEIRTVFLIINSSLGLLGGISLLVASFGIANTMIMSILERTREIGIMKAIGAEDREIKLIFFVEAALIGFAGGVLGSLAAWGIDVLSNHIAYRFFLKPRGISYVTFFALPPYLWLGAIAFAVAVSIAAALYPAARAARIDPVKALRHD
ncbi:MAG: FtsX-like permease family protein, partial [Acidobacteria bacterium]|nr:FtsX-like permease family protein [Acidobacteriota bacterium]